MSLFIILYEVAPSLKGGGVTLLKGRGVYYIRFHSPMYKGGCLGYSTLLYAWRQGVCHHPTLLYKGGIQVKRRGVSLLECMF